MVERSAVYLFNSLSD